MRPGTVLLLMLAGLFLLIGASAYFHTTKVREFEAACAERGGVVIRERNSEMTCIARQAVIL